MKTTKLAVRIAGLVLAGMMFIGLASCSGKTDKVGGSTEDKYFKNLESRVSKLEEAVNSGDRAAFDEIVNNISGFLDFQFERSSKEGKEYEKWRHGNKFDRDSFEAKLEPLKKRIGETYAKAPAQSEAEFELELTEDGNGVNITKYKGESPYVVIPSQIQGLPVVGISRIGFNDIKSVTIPRGVKTIGEKAFEGHTELTQVTLPEGLESIGRGAFVDCRNLESVKLPSTLKIIGAMAFSTEYADYTMSLASINLPDGLEFIGAQAFRKTALTSVSLPKSLNWLGSGAFEKCDNLSKINIPSGLALHYYYGYGYTSYLNESEPFSNFFSGTKIKESVMLQKVLKDTKTVTYKSAGAYEAAARKYKEFYAW
ncbi:leucine-rich repeat domain-containing protein [Treponema sp.]|uniref:leucine-rich repeat domain-containing protein n=1 Tax=Treponema sp. TaxID=166 RepID=UPI00257ADA34|nr:leucine-rich repeat domain-containing protein [Treponema sp.]MBE6354334.1 leucine-rich repeat domain-containing protein [Treponema sp.]